MSSLTSLPVDGLELLASERFTDDYVVRPARITRLQSDPAVAVRAGLRK